MLTSARAPALVVGAGADSAETWEALVSLAERLGCPVWQESFGARAGFPQDHPQFAGHLPAGRSRLRAVLDGHDVVCVIGAPAFRQYGYEPGFLVDADTHVAVLTDDPAEAHHSAAELAVVAPLAAAVTAIASSVAPRTSTPDIPPRRLAPEPPRPGEPLRAAHVFAALARRLPVDTVVVEESPSSRPDLHALIPARAPLGFLSAAMGGLGFAIPAAAGVRLATPERPVVALVGDGSSLYGIQALWSAARYGCGVLFVVLANGGYAIMDRLAEGQGGTPPWPSFEDVSVSGLAAALGCPARRVEAYDDLLAVLDEVCPTLATRGAPLVLDVAVVADPTFQP
jgi:benzoylformate decarboxylase